MSDIDDYAYEMAQEDAAEAAEVGAHDDEDPREAQAAYEAEPPFDPVFDEPPPPTLDELAARCAEGGIDFWFCTYLHHSSPFVSVDLHTERDAADDWVSSSSSGERLASIPEALVWAMAQIDNEAREMI